MPLTQTEIDAFRDFAMEKINNGGVESLDECVRMWIEEQEYQASLEALRESLDDARAGRTTPAAEFEEELCREFDLSYEESVAALRESLEDSAAGRTKPVDQAFADIRRELGLPEERSIS